MWLDAHQLDLMDRTILLLVEQEASGTGNPNLDEGTAPTTEVAFDATLKTALSVSTPAAWQANLTLAFQYVLDAGGLTEATAAFLGTIWGAESTLLSATELGIVGIKNNDLTTAQVAQQMAASPFLTQVLAANAQLGTQAMTQGTTGVNAVVKAATDVEQYQQDLEAWDTALLANFSKVVTDVG